MTVLEVPYKTQFSAGACGLAAFEMVLRYFRPSRATQFSQRKMFKKLAKTEPHGSGNYSVLANDILKLALGRNLHAGIGEISTDPMEIGEQLEYFIVRNNVPVIACQRYSDDQPMLGHYRVIYGLHEGGVLLHDPCPNNGGKGLSWSIDKVHDYWRKTGQNVVGGVAIWLSSDALINPPLAPLPTPASQELVESEWAKLTYPENM